MISLATLLYSFSGPFIGCVDSEIRTLCLQRPSVRADHLLLFVFPEGPLISDRYCKCLPFEPLFSSCSCNSVYSFTIVGNHVCLLNGNNVLSMEGTAIKVYFVAEYSPCPISDPCYTQYLTATHLINHRGK